MPGSNLDRRVIQHWLDTGVLLDEIRTMDPDPLKELSDSIPQETYPGLHHAITNLIVDPYNAKQPS